jgi:hypothetical protein
VEPMPSPTVEKLAQTVVLARSTSASPFAASVLLPGLLAGLSLAALSPVALSGCTGLIGTDGPSGSSASRPKPRDEVYPPDLVAGASDEPVPGPRLMRLTHSQWENTIRELFQLDGATGFLSTLRPDVDAVSVFAEDPTKLEVDGNLWTSYQRAATDLAERLLTDATLRAAVIPEGASTDAAGARLAIETFGLRVHRRPLTEDEVAEYLAAYEAGDAFFPNATPFLAGMATVVEAMLQSPNFLYRIETSEASVDGKIPLGDYEVASRLSYTLWDSMPDDVLFSIAAAGDLAKPAIVKEQAERMLEDPRARETVRRFHDIVFKADRLAEYTPGGALGVSGGFKNAVLDAFTRDVEDKVFSRSLGIRALLAESTAFVNAELANIYGLEGSFAAGELTSASLPEGERAGVLTHVPFLAMHANGGTTDPIHRGVHILERVVCAPPGSPPNVFQFPEPAEGQTTREVVESLTEQEGTACAGCHKGSINRFGFPFEVFSASGARRTTDNGLPVNAADVVSLDGKQVAVEDGVALSLALAESEQVHRCYTSEWIEFAYDRRAERTGADDSLITRLGQASKDNNASAKDLLVGLVVSDAFLTRSAEELPEEAP